ncbi:structural maintenance of chromosomes protein 2, partial [Asbolus verrucosus]
MYVKSVVLDGFKSYGHRTEVTGFDKQFNAITGLNGSGKSNILDSICFVLGITNLTLRHEHGTLYFVIVTQVRASSLQDLIYKSGQCGINKATVSIVFDNRNPDQCPPGFENIPEITITRQIVMGGKNKYMINGSTVPNKKVQDLFCSVQLNVNNPHFLIMQGKITKVLNMKPYDILAMIEEAAGTKMYEVKKQTAQKTIEKKDAKLNELKAVINEELTPRLEKLRTERAKFMEFKNLERELEHMLRVYQAWEYFGSQRKMIQAKKALEDEENKLKQIETTMVNHKTEIKDLEVVIDDLTKRAEADGNEDLHKIESELKEAEKSQAKVNASIRSIKDNIVAEIKKKDQLEKNLVDDKKVLKQKEEELSKVQAMFQKLKDNDERDNKLFMASQKCYEALSAGMELNEEGEAKTLLEQLMNVRQEATKANTEAKQALMRLDFCQAQLNDKLKRRVSSTNETLNDQKSLENATCAVKDLETALKKLHFDEDKMNELQERRRELLQDVRRLKSRIDNFEAQKPYTKFHYRDPEANFNRNSVFGVVCRLIKVKNDFAAVAIETAAGGRLYNVVVDSDVTGKKLLQRGDLQQRTTFIPINKIQAHKMSDDVITFAQNLVDKENVQPAMSHISYDKKLQGVMNFIFGNVFICKDISIARQVAFHDRIKRRCVTLDGDVADPAGTLSGGAPQKGDSTLKQLRDIQECEEELRVKEQELESIEAEIREMSRKQNSYMTLKQQLEIKQHEIHLIKQRLQHTSHYRRQEEIENLKTEIEGLQEKIKSRKSDEARFAEKAKEVEAKLKNSKGSKEEQIKQAAEEMKKLKAKADGSRKEWKQKEQDYETFNLEILELNKSLENTRIQIKTTEETLAVLEEKLNEITASSQELNENVLRLQAEVKKEKGAIAEKNKDIQRKIRRKEELQVEITEFEVKIKEHSHRLKKLKDDCKMLKMRQTDCEKRVKESNLKEAEKLTDEEGHQLEKKIRKTQETKNNLGRTINNKAQTLFEQQEKEYGELKRKQKIVEQDKRKIIQVIKDLDRKKEEVLTRAYDQISKDFGSIFSTLLPGANAKLLPPTGQTILQGL